MKNQILEDIIQIDNVNHKFRKDFLKEEFLWGAGLTGFSLAGGTYCLNLLFQSIAKEDFSFLSLIGGAGAALFAYIGAEKTRKALHIYSLYSASPEVKDPALYFIQNKVSSGATPIEKNYGNPLRVISSLEELSFEKESREILFIDRVRLKNHYVGEEVEVEEGTDCDGMSTHSETRYYPGNFTLSRGDESKQFSALTKKDFKIIPRCSKNLASNPQGKEFSLFCGYEKKHDQIYAPFKIMRIFVPGN